MLQAIGLPGLKSSKLLKGLYEVAYRAHAKQTKGQTADIGEGELCEWLAPFLDESMDTAKRFVEYIRERAGLLIRHKSNAYTFPHRSFQEYLAACHLATSEFETCHVTGETAYLAKAERLVRTDLDRWREVFVLSAGHLARQGSDATAVAAVNAICPEGVKSAIRSDREDWLLAALGGEALLEIGPVAETKIPNSGSTNRRIRGWLVQALVREDVLHARERASCGRILAKLGDPREEVTTCAAMEFVTVPAGPFWMGSEGDGAPEREQPFHHLTIPYDYWISRYPVTNAQYAAFVKAGGYGNGDFWKEAEEARVWKDGAVKGFPDNSRRRKPEDFGEPFNLSNHPVVGVTWYEALAFSRWLAGQLSHADRIPLDWRVTLPSEAEWEKAARGIEDAREYPWGDDFDAESCNCADLNLGGTTAVSLFSKGGSPFGCFDVAGNVWEWTRSLWGKEFKKPEFGYPYDPTDGREDLSAGRGVARVLRGGAFINLSLNVRCACRLGGLPNTWDRNLGFRVVAPPTSGL